MRTVGVLLLALLLYVAWHVLDCLGCGRAR